MDKKQMHNNFEILLEIQKTLNNIVHRLDNIGRREAKKLTESEELAREEVILYLRRVTCAIIEYKQSSNAKEINDASNTN
jgi:hypothetical protein